jgi:hypothetical protein
MLYDIFYESEAWSLTPKEGTKEITRRSIKLHNKELYDLYTSKYILIGIIKKNYEIGGVFCTCGKE